MIGKTFSVTYPVVNDIQNLDKTHIRYDMTGLATELNNCNTMKSIQGSYTFSAVKFKDFQGSHS